MTPQQKKNKVKELQSFLEKLDEYLGYVLLHGKSGLTKKQAKDALELQNTLVVYAGRFKGLITELTGKDKVTIMTRRKGLPAEEHDIDMWVQALKIPYGSLTKETLLYCINVTGMAIGKLELDIEQGIRDEQGNPIKEHVKDTEQIRPEHTTEEEALLTATSSKANWKAIESEFGTTKMGFGRRINFIRNPFKRKIIFRDVEQAFVLASLGFSKPAVILAGSVIEELLRLYLEYKKINPIKDNFDGYIKTCEQNKLLEVGISRLSDSTRHFRNLVHLSKEKSDKDTTSKSKAKGAVASIFTIADDF